MKKSEIIQMMADLIRNDRRISEDRAREKIRRRDLSDQRSDRLYSLLVPLIPGIVQRLAPSGRDPGAVDLASAVGAFNRSLDSDQRAAISRVLTAEQLLMMVDATRMASVILGEISPEDMADVVRRAQAGMDEDIRARESKMGGSGADGANGSRTDEDADDEVARPSAAGYGSRV